jgi:HPt (histidine-containing phosphotransfer) domain-containing protein
MDGFIPKPIAIEELETAVECWVQPDARAVAPARAAHAEPARAPQTDPSLVAALAAQFQPDVPETEGGIDHGVLDALATMTDEGPAFVARLVATFIEDTDARLGTLRTAVRAGAGTGATIERAAHAIKGSSGNMGATRMASLAAQLQGAGQQDDLDSATELVERLESEFHSVRAALVRAYPPRAAAAA